MTNMDYETAISIIDDKYNTHQARHIKNSLCHRSIVALGKLCQENKIRMFSNDTLERLSHMNEDQQVGWIANPLLEYLLQSLTNQILSGSYQTSNKSVTPTKPTNKKPDNQKPTNKTPQKDEDKKQDEDDDNAIMDLFG
jgi:hypothetical protein